MTTRPLVSFLVIAYKQERFIREAVQSALAQTYEPLEVVLSDDCSPDRTFEIIKEETETYRGPHRVIVNRNRSNLGLIGHVNRAWGLTQGQFIVLQGGDDISFPHRTETLVKAWKEPFPVEAVCSACTTIDGSGHPIGHKPAYLPSGTLNEFTEKWKCGVDGCTAGYSRQLIDKYGPLDAALLEEDIVLSFRALLESGIRAVDEPLIQYRQHGNNIHLGRVFSQDRSERRRLAQGVWVTVHEWIRAWDCSGRPNDSTRRHLAHLERWWRYEIAALSTSRLGAVYVALKGLLDGLSPRKTAGLIKRHAFRI
jgi:glycosyltransferase involved in cell wall biosynthesis